jgi:transcriptional regulator with XRE-family HTH domain
VSKITTKLQKLWQRFSDKEYRDEYVEDAITDRLAVQISSLRQDRGWTQADLAAQVGTQQTGICRWESGESAPTLKSLAKLASAFDVALVVRFAPFSEFVRGDGPLDKRVPDFANDEIEKCLAPTAARKLIVVDVTAFNFFKMEDARAIDHSASLTPRTPMKLEHMLQ